MRIPLRKIIFALDLLLCAWLVFSTACNGLKKDSTDDSKPFTGIQCASASPVVPAGSSTSVQYKFVGIGPVALNFDFDYDRQPGLYFSDLGTVNSSGSDGATAQYSAATFASQVQGVYVRGTGGGYSGDCAVYMVPAGGTTAALMADDPGPYTGLVANVYTLTSGATTMSQMVFGSPIGRVILPGLNVNSSTDPNLGNNPAWGTNVMLQLNGNLIVPTTGTYSFSLDSDDGSDFYLDGSQLVLSDGMHSQGSPVTKSISLSAGAHPYIVHLFQGSGGWGLKLCWKIPGASTCDVIPNSALQ